MTRLQYVDLHLGVVTRNHHFLVLPRSRRAAPRLSGGSSRARRRTAEGTDLASGSSFTKA